jgi:hypothetical protein
MPLAAETFLGENGIYKRMAKLWKTSAKNFRLCGILVRANLPPVCAVLRLETSA